MCHIPCAIALAAVLAVPAVAQISTNLTAAATAAQVAPGQSTADAKTTPCPSVPAKESKGGPAPCSTVKTTLTPTPKFEAQSKIDPNKPQAPNSKFGTESKIDPNKPQAPTSKFGDQSKIDPNKPPMIKGGDAQGKAADAQGPAVGHKTPPPANKAPPPPPKLTAEQFRAAKTKARLLASQTHGPLTADELTELHKAESTLAPVQSQIDAMTPAQRQTLGI